MHNGGVVVVVYCSLQQPMRTSVPAGHVLDDNYFHVEYDRVTYFTFNPMRSSLQRIFIIGMLLGNMCHVIKKTSHYKQTCWGSQKLRTEKPFLAAFVYIQKLWGEKDLQKRGFEVAFHFCSLGTFFLIYYKFFYAASIIPTPSSQ